MKDSRDGNVSGIFVLWSGWRGSNPWPSAWEADALPLSYTRISVLATTKIVNFQQKETRNAKKCIAGLVLLIEILGLRVILDVVIIGAFAPIDITIAIEFRAT